MSWQQSRADQAHSTCLQHHITEQFEAAEACVGRFSLAGNCSRRAVRQCMVASRSAPARSGHPAPRSFLWQAGNTVQAAPYLPQRVRAAGGPARWHSALSAAQGGSTQRRWHSAHAPAQEGGQGGKAAWHECMPWPGGNTAEIAATAASHQSTSRSDIQQALARRSLAQIPFKPHPPSRLDGWPRRRGRPQSCC